MITLHRALLGLALFASVGCTTVGSFNAGTGTKVELSGNNYKVVRTSVEGTDTGWGLLLSVLGLPVIPASPIEAVNDLVDQMQAEGKPVALVNVAQTYETSNFILFYLVKYRYRADFVEFNQ